MTTTIFALFSSVLIAGEVNGNINKLLYIDMKNPNTYPKKHIIGKFGKKVVSEYSIGIATNRRGTFKFLNFYTYPNNITKNPVQLNFTVNFYDENGIKLGESDRKTKKPIEPTDPNLLPSSLYGSNVKEIDFDRIKTYKIIFTEK